MTKFSLFTCALVSRVICKKLVFLCAQVVAPDILLRSLYATENVAARHQVQGVREDEDQGQNRAAPDAEDLELTRALHSEHHGHGPVGHRRCPISRHAHVQQ